MHSVTGALGRRGRSCGSGAGWHLARGAEQREISRTERFGRMVLGYRITYEIQGVGIEIASGLKFYA